MNFETRNLLEPIYFDSTEIGKFIRDYRCAICRSHFAKYPHVKDMYLAKCPKCGPALEHTCIHVNELSKAESNEQAAMLDLRCGTGAARAPEVVLSELGY